MSPKTVAPAVAEAPIEPPRKAPLIDPRHVAINHDGFVLREIVVRLPADFVASDLAEPGIWRKVQLSQGTTLRKLDRLVLIAHDEGYVWTTFVAQVGPDFAVLSRPDRYELQARRSEYFSDDLYKVVWGGAYFNVVRKKDHHVMSSGHTSEPSAIRALQNLYPKPL